MYINLTEKEFINKSISMRSSDLLRWLQEEGLTLKVDHPELKRGVYRREQGMDLIEYDGWSWKAFNPITFGKPISWNLGVNGSGIWVQILDVNYVPVTKGLCVRFDQDGKRTG